METKLTLRLDEDLVGLAKKEAARRGTSVSKMVAGYFHAIRALDGTSGAPLPPVTSALLGSLRKTKAGKPDYRKHLEEKYL
jgi:hypothetical protein